MRRTRVEARHTRGAAPRSADPTNPLPGPLPSRLAAGAPDAGACGRQLAGVRSRLLGTWALLTLANPTILGEIMLEPLDPDAPSPATGLEPPLSHWVYTARQMALSQDQVHLCARAGGRGG